jgi:hypothetical protein
LQFAKERLGKMPSKLTIEDLDPPFLGVFLEHLEKVRKNTARTRNARLAAIHSFFQYVALEEPAHALHCQRVCDAEQTARTTADRVSQPR